MFKKTSPTHAASKPASAADKAPKSKRSKLMLGLMVALPVSVIAGGAYAGWSMFLAPEPAAAEISHESLAEQQKVAALALESAAETSATYSYALAELIGSHCGVVNVPALKAASEAEAEQNAKLVSLSWIAANRRLTSVTEKSCSRVRTEIFVAETQAYNAANDGKGKEKGKGGGH
ncbi:MAG: hypothetical protein WBF87_02955 [Mesorhizobium sp.]